MSGRDLGASVRQRLLNQAREQGRTFQELDSALVFLAS